jgi:hypothetical protein
MGNNDGNNTNSKFQDSFMLAIYMEDMDGYGGFMEVSLGIFLLK